MELAPSTEGIVLLRQEMVFHLLLSQIYRGKVRGKCIGERVIYNKSNQRAVTTISYEWELTFKCLLHDSLQLSCTHAVQKANL